MNQPPQELHLGTTGTEGTPRRASPDAVGDRPRSAASYRFSRKAALAVGQLRHGKEECGRALTSLPLSGESSRYASGA